MDILMVTAELAPYMRESEAGDAVASLSRALTQIGHRVTVAMPGFEGVEQAGLMVARRLSPLELPTGERVTVFDGQLPSGVGVVLFESERLSPRRGAYGQDGKEHPDNPARFTTLCRAAVALCQQRAQQGMPFEVIHAHDWPGAIISLLPRPLPVVLTVHDASRQGSITVKEFDGLGIDADAEQRERLRFGSRANLLKAGMLSANVVATVAQSAAAELRDPELFGAMATSLAEMGVEVFGVLGGVDYAVYNPATDTALSSRFDAEAPEKKGSSKTALCRELEFELDPERPLIVYAGGIEKERGADLVAAALPGLLKLEANVLVVGTGDSKSLLRQFGSAKLKKLPNYRFIDDGSGAPRRRAIAAADIALCPDRARKSGHDVRVAQRYGAAPVALAVSGSRDAIVDCDAELLTGTGFLFEEDRADALLAAVERASAACYRPGWGKLRQRIMRLDLGWEGPARRYAQLYRMALKS